MSWRNLLEPSAGFETPGDWTFNAQATRVDDQQAPVHGGTWACQLLGIPATQPPLPPKPRKVGTASRSFSLVPGLRYPVEVWRNTEFFASTTFRIRIDPGTGAFDLQFDVSSTTVGYEKFAPGDFLAIGGAGRIELRNEVQTATSVVLVDDAAVLENIEAAALMKSTLPAFLDKVKTLMLAIDPNIGKVHTAPVRWIRDSESRPNSVITLVTPSVLDPAIRAGDKATRFWFLDGHVETLPLTNGSSEYRTKVRLVAFFSHVKEDPQSKVLRTAALELIDKLNERVVELTTLNTGDGYMGYLEDRPTMTEDVQDAEIEGLGMQGHTVAIDLTYHEEISGTP